jgi:adenylosuccinate synthase
MSNSSSKFGAVTAVIGGQWGDEGKGKLIDILGADYDIIVRATGGANAGHTVYIPDPLNLERTQKFVFHLMPSGVLYPNTVNIVGNGCVMHLPSFFEEVAFLKEHNIDIQSRVFISDRVHLVFEYHKIIDKLLEERKGKGKVGTTGRGIGPTYTEKMARSGIRLHELADFENFIIHMKTNVELLKKMYNFEFDADAEIEYYRGIQKQVLPFIKDTAFYINNAISEGKKVLMEGANGTLLDIDHGTYPFVTSSNASVGGIITGSGVGATRLDSAIGIMKAYCTRVGSGPFPTELTDFVGESLRTKGGEFGATTGRPRRCGWFDAVASKYSVTINNLTAINLTKLDILSDLDIIKIATKYVYHGKELETFPASAEILAEAEPIYEEMPGWKEDISNIKKISKLPKNALNYVNKIEELMGCPIEFVGVGVSRSQMAVK